MPNSSLLIGRQCLVYYTERHWIRGPPYPMSSFGGESGSVQEENGCTQWWGGRWLWGWLYLVGEERMAPIRGWYRGGGVDGVASHPPPPPPAKCVLYTPHAARSWLHLVVARGRVALQQEAGCMGTMHPRYHLQFGWSWVPQSRKWWLRLFGQQIKRGFNFLDMKAESSWISKVPEKALWMEKIHWYNTIHSFFVPFDCKCVETYLEGDMTEWRVR